MFKISIGDLTPLTVALGITSDVVQPILENVAASARDYWIRLAAKDTSSFRNDYVKGILPVESADGEVKITLEGEVPHMLEDGSPQTDLRDVLLNEKTTKIVPRGQRGMHRSKNGGLYRSIPFRHLTPSSDIDIPQDKSGQVVQHANRMSKRVYAQAIQLKPTTTVYGDQLPYEPATTKNVTTGTPHKSAIHSGMIKIEKTYDKATQYTYKTFRTISTNVRDDSWIRKEIDPRNYAEKVSKYALDLMEKALSKLER